MSEDPKSASEMVPVLSANHALFLDFDGTLAPIQDDPDTVALPDFGRDCLSSIAQFLDGALVLISGRGIHDLSSRTPLELWRAGGHGMDVCAPGERPAPNTQHAPASLTASVQGIVNTMEGVRLEHKGKVLAVHYRHNAHAGPALAEHLKLLADATEDYGFQHGKMVIELKPVGTDKGTALRSLMLQSPFAGREPIMIGDDTTDEDAMSAAADLGGFGIKVGKGETSARHRFADTAAVWNWLKGIVNEHA